jgi:hypothetical protein
MYANTLRALNFFTSLHLTILERPAYFDFFSQLTRQTHDRLLQKICRTEEQRVFGDCAPSNCQIRSKPP